jgi:hypothetical protein
MWWGPSNLLPIIEGCLQAFFVDLYADACELVKKQSVHIWMLRFKDAPPELVARGENVVEILVNEGGRTEPKCMEACFTLILEWLVALGPDSGVLYDQISYPDC